MTVQVDEQLNRLQTVATSAAAQQANILDIHQRRTFNLADVRETEIDLMVETRGPEVVEAMLKAIAAKGYEARSFAFE